MANVWPEEKRTGPRDEAGPTSTTDAMVAERRAAERSRRSRRWARRELDDQLGVQAPAGGTVDYLAMGFTLDMAERRAAGRALGEAAA